MPAVSIRGAPARQKGERPMENTKLLQQFLTSRTTAGRRDTTVVWYADQIKSFLAWLEHAYPGARWLDLTPDQIEEYLAAERSHVSGATIRPTTGHSTRCVNGPPSVATCRPIPSLPFPGPKRKRRARGGPRRGQPFANRHSYRTLARLPRPLFYPAASGVAFASANWCP